MNNSSRPLPDIVKNGAPKSILQLIYDNEASLSNVDDSIYRGADVNSVVKYTDETIFNFVMKWRAGGNMLSVAKLLLDNGAEIVGSKKSDFNMPALHLCVGEGNIEYVKFLLENGSPVDEVYYGDTPLLVAAASIGFHPKNIMEIIRLLVLHNKANVNATTKESAITDRFLYEDFLYGTTRRTWKSYMQHGKMTALHISVWRHEGELSRFLLENGADVNAKDQLGHTPLHLVAMPRTTDRDVDSTEKMLKLLFEYNANPYAKNVVGETALAIAEFNLPPPVGVAREEGEKWMVPYSSSNGTNGRMIIAGIKTQIDHKVRLEKEKQYVFWLGHIPHSPGEDGKSSRIQELEKEIVQKIIDEAERMHTSDM